LVLVHRRALCIDHNAYIHAAKLMVSSDVSGIVSDVLVHEGQTVRQGDVLFRIDPEQFKIALDNAKAQLAQTALNLESMEAGLSTHAERRHLAAGASRACPKDL
jgi:multidrug resistance efflux pump